MNYPNEASLRRWAFNDGMMLTGCAVVCFITAFLSLITSFVNVAVLFLFMTTCLFGMEIEINKARAEEAQNAK
jgi:hypothetical protein